MLGFGYVVMPEHVHFRVGMDVEKTAGNGHRSADESKRKSPPNQPTVGRGTHVSFLHMSFPEKDGLPMPLSGATEGCVAADAARNRL